jgi:predicted esterase YcpF (UPF0227 family)
VTRPGSRIAYLHGFNSGPTSIKGRQLADAIALLPETRRPEYFLPQLHDRPREAMRAVESWIRGSRTASKVDFLDENLTLVGSSLGGFYATYLAERHGAKAVLINPAIRPFESLAAYLGPQLNPYTGVSYELTPEHFAELKALSVPRITRPERYLLLVQSDDELLDYRAAVAYYAGAWQFVQGGGDHAYRDFAAQIPAVLRFSGVDLPAASERR